MASVKQEHVFLLWIEFRFLIRNRERHAPIGEVPAGARHTVKDARECAAKRSEILDGMACGGYPTVSKGHDSASVDWLSRDFPLLALRIEAPVSSMR